MKKSILMTEKKQELYEDIFSKNANLENIIPKDCGNFGKTCKCMNKETLCSNCSLFIFIATIEEIKICSDKKDDLGITYLYDSDIYDIQNALKTRGIKVKYSYIDNILDYLSKGDKNEG